MAYGGAGIIISQPLMDSMAAIWDECLIGFESIFGGAFFSMALSEALL